MENKETTKHVQFLKFRKIWNCGIDVDEAWDFLLCNNFYWRNDLLKRRSVIYTLTYRNCVWRYLMNRHEYGVWCMHVQWKGWFLCFRAGHSSDIETVISLSPLLFGVRYCAWPWSSVDHESKSYFFVWNGSREQRVRISTHVCSIDSYPFSQGIFLNHLLPCFIWIFLEYWILCRLFAVSSIPEWDLNEKSYINFFKLLFFFIEIQKIQSIIPLELTSEYP